MSSSPAASNELSRARANLVLTALFLGTFILGSAEIVVVGLLDLVAEDLAVSISSAGLLVTAYALGLSIGGPSLATLTIRVGRRPLLNAALLAYLVVTAAVFLSSSFPVVIAARVITGSVHGLFVGVAFSIATAVVPVERVGRAISIVIGGFAISLAFGVPLGTLVGRSLGWRETFGALTVLGALVLVGLTLVVPPVAASAGAALSQIRRALSLPVLAVLGFATVVFAGQYAVLTYIAPFLQDRTGVSDAALSAFLLAYGAATAVGALGGGRLADHSAARTILLANAVLVLALAILSLVAEIPLLVVAALIVWGVVGLGMVPSVQYRVVSLAGAGGDLAATLPASAFNAGIAIGSLIGGWVLASNGSGAPAIAGAIICAFALPIAWATARFKPPPSDRQTPTHGAALQ